MSPQRDDKITRQNQEQHIKNKEYSWTLGNPKRTSRTESLDTSTMTYMDI